jgi:hypothetical protein
MAEQATCMSWNAISDSRSGKHIDISQIGTLSTSQACADAAQVDEPT